ncbi:tubby-like F-box protein 7 [Triticum dicoccoides]|uniref:Tubby-like F-box protein n=1 Tax=Triticum aestivum TaxID=4565 RepID=A0A3B6CH59_WHEAT|nr:tubby-like F-box protein 7 [Triticum dicoccoides]XP_044327065.1 tubby-like F-box protein 7 [Triticum aestivum]
MTLRSIVRDLRESFGNLSRRNFEAKISSVPSLSGHHRGKSLESASDLQDSLVTNLQGNWASLPPELLRDVMKRLEEDDSNWPSRKDVVACASVCTTWRDMCKDIVRNPEFCGKLTFPVSLKQPGSRDGLIQCFIKRDKSKLTYRLYLSLTSAVLDDNGKFLLSAKRSRRTTYTDYAISMDPKNISRSSSGYIGKLRSNFLGTKFIIYDTQPSYNASKLCPQERTSRRFSSRKVSPKVPAATGSYPIAQVNYELNVLGTRGPRRMQCTMNSIPTSAVDPDGVVPGQPKELLPRLFEESFRTTASSRYSTDFSSCHFSEFGGGPLREEGGDENAGDKESPLVLKNKSPRWHEQLQCWCLNFRGRVTVASVKNFQLIAAPAPPPPASGGEAAPEPSSQTQPPQQQPTSAAAAQPQPAGSSLSASSSSSSSHHDTVLLQFGKVSKDTFTMDYRYPLSAFQAFAICLTSFDTKLACE